MSRFAFSATGLNGLTLVERQRIEDERGFLARLWCADEFATVGWAGGIAQINQTVTHRAGTVRGMHFQHPPHAEFKLISCLQGEVYDVAVDLRRGSPTFLKWYGNHLSANNRRGLLIPEGFAHGFQSITDDVELLYLHSRAYAADAEGALNSCDPRLGIGWPLPVSNMSPRDHSHSMLNAEFTGLTL
jgi:dTDP-4-dehydrorhamnose 3,5-epimerase